MPAKKPTATVKAAPVPTPFEVGEIFTFAGYSALAEGQVPALADGEYLQVSEVGENIGGVQYYLASAIENTPDQGDETRQDMVAHAELVVLTPEEEADIQARFAVPADETAAADEIAEPVLDEDGNPVAVVKKAKARSKAKPKPILAFAAVSAALASGTDLIALAKSLSDQASQTWFELGEVLTLIKKNKSYTELQGEDGAPLFPDSKEGFSRFVEQYLEIGYRTAQHWIKIVTQLKRIGTHSPDILVLGWAKLKEIARVIESREGPAKEVAEYVSDLIAFAKGDGITGEDLKAEINGNQWIVTAETPVAADGTATPAPQVEARLKKSFFVIGDDQNAMVNAALAMAKEQAPTDNDDKAFMYIIDQFIAANTVAPVVVAPAKSNVTAPARPAPRKVAARA